MNETVMQRMLRATMVTSLCARDCNVNFDENVHFEVFTNTIWQNSANV